MPDAALKYDDNKPMSKNKKGSEVELEEDETTEAEAEDEESDDADETEEDESTDDATDESDEDDESEEDEDEEESEDDDESKEDDSSSTDDDEIDLDKEIEREKKHGQPDKKAAGDAFKKRDKERKGGKGDSVSRAELQEILAADRKERQRDSALAFAKEMAGSDKEAELIVSKWNNRTFPNTLTLREQIEEAYAITHAKRIRGQRDEAMRALKGKQGVKKDASGKHHDPKQAINEPKLPPAEAATLRQSGFSWSPKNRRYQKRLPNGRVLVRDPKTKQIRLLSRGQK